jgi:hypothetical protein
VIKESVFNFLSFEKVLLDDWVDVALTINPLVDLSSSDSKFMVKWSLSRKAFWVNFNTVRITTFTIGMQLATLPVDPPGLVRPAKNVYLRTQLNCDMPTVATSGRYSMDLDFNVYTAGSVLSFTIYPQDGKPGVGARSELDGCKLFGNAMLFLM